MDGIGRMARRVDAEGRASDSSHRANGLDGAGGALAEPAAPYEGSTKTGGRGGGAARTRETILDGAYAVLLSEGLPSLSYDRVARACGTSRQLVRYHFPDGDALMVRLCDRLAASYRDALLRAVARRPAGVPRLHVFLDFYLDLLDGEGKPRDDQVYDAMVSLAAGSEAVRRRLHEQYALLGQVVAHEMALAHPELGPERAAELSWLFVSLMYGHWKMVASLGFAEAHRHVTRAALDRLIASYLEAAREGPALRVWEAEPDE